MAKKAVIIGINYPKTNAELKGCINDAVDMHKLLVDTFHFSMEDIKVLLDDKPPEDSGLSEDEIEMPTGKNIRKALKDLVADVSPGDILFIHYSGHGTQVPVDGLDFTNGDPEADNKDEALVPCDMNLILDDDLRDIFKDVPKSVNLTFIADCCHSGTILDHTNISIGDGGAAGNPLEGLMSLIPGIAGFRELQEGDTKVDNDEEGEEGDEDANGDEEDEEVKDNTMLKKRRRHRVLNRSLSLGVVAGILTKSSGNEVAPNSMRSTLSSIFGPDASQTIQKYLTKIKELMAQQSSGGEKNEAPGGGLLAKLCGCLGGGGSGSAGTQGAAGGFNIMSMASQFIGPGKLSGPTEKLDDDVGVLISGCQDKQTSADIRPKPPGKPHGALTSALTAAIRKDAESAGEDDAHPVKVTYRELVTSLNSFMDSASLGQDPGLCSSERNADIAFLCPFPMDEKVEEEPGEEGAEPGKEE